jgi:hypothetical protein
LGTSGSNLTSLDERTRICYEARSFGRIAVPHGSQPSGKDHLFELFGVSGAAVPETPNT